MKQMTYYNLPFVYVFILLCQCIVLLWF